MAPYSGESLFKVIIMDIYAESGTKVKFIEDSPSKGQINWGGHDSPIGVLNVGSEYTIERTDVRSSHTKVFLKEFPDKQFNSVWFE